ncbi:MAG: CDP-alcohol phosphatidyltransferase family protein [Acidimicrobiales bacterium]
MIDGRRGQTAGEDDVQEVSCGDPGGVAANASDPRRHLFSSLRRIGLGRRLARHGVKADQVTFVGIFLAGVTGVVIALGHLWIGVVLVAVGGLMDALDGAVAKASGSSSRRGAFLDSVSDRVADAFMFGGVAWYLAARHTPELALLPFAILAVGNVISYERAKAESFGWEAKGGLMERAERLIFLGVALGFNIVLVPLLWALLALCLFTAGQRFHKIWCQATAELNGLTIDARPTALAAWRPARVESRWRAWREVRASGSGTWHGRSDARSSRSRRRGREPLSTRLRSVLATERVGGPRMGRSRPARPGSRASERLAQRRQEGAASALRRRLGTGR